jgi:Rieske 2Fe-2S family protein
MRLPASAAKTLQPGNGYRLPPEAYFEPGWFAREQQQLFRRTWNYVGDAREVSKPGDYLTADIGAAPIAVVRDENGVMRAFHNICRHRGAKLLDAAGNCDAIVCPYHRWRYQLDGQLSNVPQQHRQLPLLDLTEWPLLPAKLAERGGMLFVNPDGQAPDINGWLAGMTDLIDAFAPQRLKILSLGTFEFAANWKFYIENHIDWYHLWYTHPETLRMWRHGDGQMHQTGAHWSSFEPARAGFDAMTPGLKPLPGLSEQHRQNGAHLLFPNLTLFTGDGYFATGLVTPIAPDRTRMHFCALVDPDQPTSAELEAGLLKAFQEITEVEDAGMTERLQAAVQSDAFAVGPMTLEYEAPIASFHDEYLRLMET